MSIEVASLVLVAAAFHARASSGKLGFLGSDVSAASRLSFFSTERVRPRRLGAGLSDCQGIGPAARSSGRPAVHWGNTHAACTARHLVPCLWSDGVDFRTREWGLEKTKAGDLRPPDWGADRLVYRRRWHGCASSRIRNRLCGLANHRRRTSYISHRVHLERA